MASIGLNSGTEAQYTNLPIAHRTQSTIPLPWSSRSGSEQSPTSAAGLMTTPTTHPSLGIVQRMSQEFVSLSESTDDGRYRP